MFGEIPQLDGHKDLIVDPPQLYKKLSSLQREAETGSCPGFPDSEPNR